MEHDGIQCRCQNFVFPPKINLSNQSFHIGFSIYLFVLYLPLISCLNRMCVVFLFKWQTMMYVVRIVTTFFSHSPILSIGLQIFDYPYNLLTHWLPHNDHDCLTAYTFQYRVKPTWITTIIITKNSLFFHQSTLKTIAFNHNYNFHC